MEEKKYLKWYNKIGYGSGDIAGNVVYAFLTSFMMVYLTDSVGLAAGVVGTLIAVSKLFDGFTDIFFGSMIDKTHSKMGKAKPWMLYGYIGCAITLVCCFAVPVSFGTTAKYAWFFISYTLLNGVFYTANNIAYSALTSLITKNSKERVQMGSYRFIFAFSTSLLIQAITAIQKGVVALEKMGKWIAAGGSAFLLVFILIVGIIAGAAFSSNSESSESLSEEVLAYTSVIQQYASQYGIPEYVSAIQAIMMQESGGRGTDPMQCSESPYNTRFPHTPGSITDPDYSIEVGVQTFADCIRQAGCSSPQDLDKLKLAWQGYNYGNGYIGWALQRGGYTEANALQFSQEQAASHGWSSYGDPQYVPHVMRYYSGGSLFAGLFGNQQIVSVAMGQLGNSGGQKFWSWYGFDSRVEWCACFVSWCADQSGLIASGNVPKFSLCSDGVSWFQGKNKWQSGGTTPTAGMIIFFDWDHDGTSDHVGIVEKCEGGRVYTIEGNSSDQVRQRNYAVDYSSIMGYGVIN